MITPQFTQYVFYKTERGNIIGRPKNPFEESDNLFEGFEEFAKTKTFYTIEGILPGVYHRSWIQELDSLIETEADFIFTDSEVPVERITDELGNEFFMLYYLKEVPKKQMEVIPN